MAHSPTEEAAKMSRNWAREKTNRRKYRPGAETKSDRSSENQRPMFSNSPLPIAQNEVVRSLTKV